MKNHTTPSMTTQYWLVKQEPASYSWTDFIREGRTAWTGVRNYAARHHLRAMRAGDRVFFYHSGEDKCVVGLAKVTRPAFADPTADEEGWVAVELAPVQPLPRPVTLAQIKADPALEQMELVRQSRLSVSPVRPAEFARLKKLGGL
jgi:predicted RNA-binding protein with PUA-like domain